MKSLVQLIKNYCDRFPEETVAKTMLSFIETENNHFSRTNHHGHFTGSAWVVNPGKTKILMTHHKKLGKWLQLGGHADGEDDLLLVALREAKEESGMNDIINLNDEIFDIDIHEVPARGSESNHLHYDIRFLFEAYPNKEPIIVSHESNDVSWIPLDKIEEFNSEKSILRMVDKTKLFGKNKI